MFIFKHTGLQQILILLKMRGITFCLLEQFTDMTKERLKKIYIKKKRVNIQDIPKSSLKVDLKILLLLIHWLLKRKKKFPEVQCI